MPRVAMPQDQERMLRESLKQEQRAAKAREKVITGPLIQCSPMLSSDSPPYSV